MRKSQELALLYLKPFRLQIKNKGVGLQEPLLWNRVKATGMLYTKILHPTFITAPIAISNVKISVNIVLWPIF